MADVERLGRFPVVELRRYVTVDGEREHFARFFDAYFPEAFQQLGAIAFGQFLDRDDPNGFTWLRGFRDTDTRATANAGFYYGPVWKEHAATMNDRMVECENVLLLSPVAGRDLVLLPAVDPVREAPGAAGVVVAQVLSVVPGAIEALCAAAEPAFADCRAAGAREAGLLATLDVPNTFPQLSVRTDGPHVVWLGVLPDDSALGTIRRLLGDLAASVSAAGLTREEPELLVLDPTARSRLRYV